MLYKSGKGLTNFSRFGIIISVATYGGGENAGVVQW